MHRRLIMNRNPFLWLLCMTTTICGGKQVCTFSEVPDSAGRPDDYSGYKTVANPDNCKEYCRQFFWCRAAQFDFNTYECFLYQGRTPISPKKGSVFMAQRCTEVTTTQPTTTTLPTTTSQPTTTTTTATSPSTTVVPTSMYIPSSFYTTLTTVGSSTATVTATEPSQTDDRPTTWQPLPKLVFTKGKQVCTFSEVPDSAGRPDDYSGYKTVANPDNCKDYCRKFFWCRAAQFDFNTYECFLYQGDIPISPKKGSVFMAQRCTEDTSLSTSEESSAPSSSVEFTTPQTTSSLDLLPAIPDSIFSLYNGQSLPIALDLVDSNIVETNVDQIVRKEAPVRRRERKPQLCFNIKKFMHVTLRGETYLVLSCDKGKVVPVPILQTTHVVCFTVSYGGTNGNDPVLRVGKHHCEIPDNTISRELR